MTQLPSVPRIDAVVFDMDGLMFNTEDVFRATGTELLRRRGKSAPPELFAGMMGRRAPEAFEVMIEMMSLTDALEVLQEESDRIFRELLDQIVQPMPGLMEVLRQIEARGLPKGVATSSHRPYLEELLGRFDLLDRFDLTLTAEDVTHGKPHPEIYETAAERLNVACEHMLVLEDSQAGTEAAAAAGAFVVAIPGEHGAMLDYSRAHAVVDRLDAALVISAVVGEGRRSEAEQEPSESPPDSGHQAL